MAGGSGKRLWPLSRQGEPKQLLPLFDGRSLLQLAYDRVLRVVPPGQVLVCTGAAYAHEVVEQLPGLLPQNVLGEPQGRDSLNAVAWPAAVLRTHVQLVSDCDLERSLRLAGLIAQDLQGRRVGHGLRRHREEARLCGGMTAHRTVRHQCLAVHKRQRCICTG